LDFAGVALSERRSLDDERAQRLAELDTRRRPRLPAEAGA